MLQLTDFWQLFSTPQLANYQKSMLTFFEVSRDKWSEGFIPFGKKTKYTILKDNITKHKLCTGSGNCCMISIFQWNMFQLSDFWQLFSMPQLANYLKSMLILLWGKSRQMIRWFHTFWSKTIHTVAKDSILVTGKRPSYRYLPLLIL